MSRTVLFVHNNFPAQYRHLARQLAARPDCRVYALGSPTARAMPGVELLKYRIDSPPDAQGVHSFARRFNNEAVRAEQVMYLTMALRSSGVKPDIIFVHPGWGESLPLRAAFPDAKIVVFCEFFYRTLGTDVGFDREFPQLGLDGLVRVHLRNAATLLALADADHAIAPTEWQRETYPPEFVGKIDVIHDGIDTEEARPDPAARVVLPRNAGVVRAGDKVITFVSRNLEPYRGIHIFMRALPRILAAHPDAQVLLVGGHDVSYGSRSEDGRSWASIFLSEIRDRVDTSRIHMMGPLSREAYLQVLQVSAAHVYLTYPFVLSWSMMEAMSAGCLVIGSDTPPVRELIRDGETGLLVPFFSPDALADKVNAALQRPSDYTRLRRAARQRIVDDYAVETCVRRQMQLIDDLLAPRRMAASELGRQALGFSRNPVR